MRCTRALGALVSLSSLLVVCSPLGCAKSDGDQLTFGGDGSADGAKDTGHGFDSTTPPHDAGRDTTFGSDSFVGPPPDAKPKDAGKDVHHDTGFGFDAGPVFFGNPGTPCATVGATQAQSCGICGTQTSMCIVEPDGGVPFDAGVDSSHAIDAGHDATASDAGADAEGDAAHDAADDAVHPHDAGHDAGKDAGKDASTGFVWGEWGACSGQIDGGCLPGTTTTASCGTCGTQMLVCEPDCQMGSTNCVGQIPDACAPGTTLFALDPTCAPDAGDAGGALFGRSQVCSPTCAYPDASTCETVPTTLTISPIAGGKVGTYVDFDANDEGPLREIGDFPPTSCPVAIASTTDTSTFTPFAYVTVVNPSTTQTADISVWTVQVAGSPPLDVAMTYYSAIPTNNAGLKACKNVITDVCDTFFVTDPDPTACQGSFGGLMIDDANDIMIAPGKSIVIFVQDQNSDAADLGVVGITVRTESLM